MYREIQIGERKEAFLAMASVNLYYKRVFRSDAFKDQSAEDVADKINFVLQMGYIMAEFAKAKDNGGSAYMAKLSEDGFAAWLDGFDNGALLDAVDAIVAVYNGQAAPSSKEKKDQG